METRYTFFARTQQDAERIANKRLQQIINFTGKKHEMRSLWKSDNDWTAIFIQVTNK